jgi:hypothetical protein
VDSENSHEQLINSRLAYVAVSRGRYDAQIYTNDADRLGDELSREVSKRSAISNEQDGSQQFSEVQQSHLQDIAATKEQARPQAQERSHSQALEMGR